MAITLQNEAKPRRRCNRPHWKAKFEALVAEQSLAHGMPDAADFYGVDGAFMPQLYALAVLRRLNDADRAAVIALARK